MFIIPIWHNVHFITNLLQALKLAWCWHLLPRTTWIQIPHSHMDFRRRAILKSIATNQRLRASVSSVSTGSAARSFLSDVWTSNLSANTAWESQLQIPPTRHALCSPSEWRMSTTTLLSSCSPRIRLHCRVSSSSFSLASQADSAYPSVFYFVVLLRQCGRGWLSRYSESLRTGRSGARVPAGTRATYIQNDPRAYPAYCTRGTETFPSVKQSGRGVGQPVPSSTEVEERVELYLYSHSVSIWQVIGWILVFITSVAYELSRNFTYCISPDFLGGLATRKYTSHLTTETHNFLLNSDQ